MYCSSTFKNNSFAVAAFVKSRFEFSKKNQNCIVYLYTFDHLPCVIFPLHNIILQPRLKINQKRKKYKYNIYAEFFPSIHNYMGTENNDG